MDYSLPGSSIHGIFQVRILECVAFPFSRSPPRHRTQVSHTAGWFFIIWAIREAQEYWSEYIILSPVDLLDLGVKPGSPSLQVDSLSAELPEKPYYVLWFGLIKD